MTDLQFDEQNSFKSRTVLGDYRKPWMVDWLQRKGIVKSEKGAKHLLVGTIVLFFGLSVAVVYVSFFDSSNDVTLQEKIEKVKKSGMPPNIQQEMIDYFMKNEK